MMRDFWALPPYEQMLYVGAPQLSIVAMSGLQPTVQLLPQNPNRIFLSISAVAFMASNYVFPYDGSQSGATGFNLGQSNPTITLTSCQHGPIVTSSWWASSTNTSNQQLTIIEQSVLRWPEEGEDIMAKLADPGIRIPPAKITTAPGKAGRGLLDFWAKLTGRG